MKKKIGSPIGIAIVLVCLGMLTYWIVVQSAAVKRLEEKLYLQSDTFAETLVDLIDYVERNRIEQDGSEEAKYENLKNIQYYMQNEEDFYFNEAWAVCSGENPYIQDSVSFFNQLSNLKKKSSYYVHLSAKNENLLEFDCPFITDTNILYQFENKIRSIVEDESRTGYDNFDLYLFIPNGRLSQDDYVTSQMMQYETIAKQWIFLMIQLGIGIIFAVIVIIQGFVHKEALWGMDKVERLPIEIRALICIGIIGAIPRLLERHCNWYFTERVFEDYILINTIYSVVEIIILSVMGYFIVDFIGMCKGDFLKAIQRRSFIYQKNLMRKIYALWGIDLRRNNFLKLLVMSIVHTIILIWIVGISCFDSENAIRCCLVLGGIAILLGEVFLKDWNSALVQVKHLTNGIKVKRELESIGTYRVYMWSGIAAYMISLVTMVCLSNEVSTIGYIMAVGYGVIGFVVANKVVGNFKEMYQYVNSILFNKKQDTPNIGFLNPIIQALEQVKNGFNEAVQKEVMSQRMKTELISNVSHDLKTPLTAIISYVDLLKNEHLSEEERKKYISILDQKSQRLKVLIEDLFEASKAASGNIEFVKDEIDLVALLKQTLGELGEKIEASGLQFKVHTSKEKLVSQLDGRRTYRIFENLIGNILKYAAPHSRVYIECEKEDEEVLLTFKNMSACEMNFAAEEIVERFKRGDESRHTEGSGLGLAIAKNLTELQGGKFEIYIDGDLFKVILRFKLLGDYEVDLESHYKQGKEGLYQAVKKNKIEE